MTIVVTGGSGFIGTALTRALLEKGHTVIIIDKKGPALTHRNLFYIPCDLQLSTLPFNVLERTDAIINLAGRSMFYKWTKKVKDEIYASRILSTKNLIESLGQTGSKPPIFISASTTAFYGEGKEEVFDERSPKGDTFLSDLARDWEEEATKAENFGCRVVIARTAPVLGKKGFLAPLWSLARIHITGKFSKKDFFSPWIHINDIVRVYIFALETGTLQGVVNAVAPATSRQSDILAAFKKATKSFSLGTLPLTKLFLGSATREFFVDQKVVPQRLIDKGFEFSFTDPESALKILKHAKK